MLTTWLLFISAIGTALTAHAATKPAAFFLAGDSTTHTGSGWGDGFLNTTLKNGAIGTNYGVSGATTASFRAGGTWAEVISAVKNHSSSYSPYVTIQFGHNDQKNTSGETIAQFTTNLEAFVNETRTAGGIPILLTPLSRRDFSGDTVEDNLANVRNGTIAAATAVQSELLHLNERSAAYLNAIGPTDAYTYNLASDDYTHLNVNGSVVFGGLVAKLILEDSGLSVLKSYLQVDATLSKDLDAGIYYWP